MLLWINSTKNTKTAISLWDYSTTLFSNFLVLGPIKKPAAQASMVIIMIGQHGSSQVASCLALNTLSLIYPISFNTFVTHLRTPALQDAD